MHRTSQVLTILALVGAGRGLAFVPESTQQIATPSVKYLPLDHGEDSRIELHALWSPENTNPVVERLLEHLRADGLGPS
ncbi:LysR substrate-binding domain-containing protein [Nesterenkonia lacusekhoensis]|uniref:DNA-binding transcriptional LysR family regulator n=1 Tax=Nesterenkonia lacusekhoensis TaxID=150832 RepID=A0ABS4T4P9_9MICC|nr:DNA-binding transcriptional LysR family regulator [Nesterenkonia lacusekhoensis]